LLLQQSLALYQNITHGQAVEEPVAAINYRDLAYWQHLRVLGREGQQLRKFWLKELEGLNALIDFPYEEQDIPWQLGQTLHLAVNPQWSASLLDRCQQWGVSQASLMTAAYLLLLGAYCRHTTINRDMHIGMPVAGRSHQASEELA